MHELMPHRRTTFGAAGLAIALVVLGLRIDRINRPVPFGLAPRTVHLLYTDSLRQELLAFAEQYGRPVFYSDSTPPVTGHGRVQLGRLRQALFQPNIQYSYTDHGFFLDYRDDLPPMSASTWRIWSHAQGRKVTPWPQSATQYAEIRRVMITPRWPDPPARSRRPAGPAATPRNDASFALLPSP